MKKIFTGLVVISALIGSILLAIYTAVLLWVSMQDTTKDTQDINRLGSWKTILLDEWYLGSDATPRTSETMTFHEDFTVDLEFDSYIWDIQIAQETTLYLNIYKDGKKYGYVTIDKEQPYKLWYSICSIKYCETNRYFYNDLAYDGL